MSRYGTSGQLGLYFVPTIASIAAPTVTEISAGVNLATYVTRDGIKTPASGNTVDSSVVGSAYTPQVPGTYGGDAISLTCHRGSKGGVGGDDIAWSTFVRGTQGFIVIARSGWAQSSTTGLGTPSGTPTLADRCEVYPASVLTRAMADTAENQTSRFDVTLTVVADPNLEPSPSSNVQVGGAGVRSGRGARAGRGDKSSVLIVRQSPVSG